MEKEDSLKVWEQLNIRSRWYSSQLWYIPIAYLGVLGIILARVSDIDFTLPVTNIALIVFGVFNLALFVHISAIKYYERKAVSDMRRLENKMDVSLSAGFSKWYFDYSLYLKVILASICLVTVKYGILNITNKTILSWLIFTVLGLVFICLFILDKERTAKL